VRTLISRFWSTEDGATAIEYALIASFIALAIITATSTIGTKVGSTFQKVADQMQ
jgi:pilus assembly protein Flp/PilA